MAPIAQLKTALSDRYTIEREIGAGGMATVYLARDVRHDRLVALKVLNPDLGAVLGVERFLAEIRVTANLQHPNLLPLFDSGEAGGLLFYVMPYVDGESLRVRLDREKQLPIDDALRIAGAIASALDYAHHHGVIHRDLKPENVLLQAGQPVIADFGIALAVSKAGGNRITQTGLSLGTPQYMSPEQATGDRAIDGRSDIYSLAAMTYEMLSGEAPHIGNTAQAIIARVLTEKPRAIRSTRAAVPAHVEAALERGLEKLPADRFSTAHEFADALQGRGLSSAPTAATVSRTVLQPASGWRTRLRDPVLLALATLAIGASALALALAFRRPAAESVPPLRFILSAPDTARPFDNYPWPAAISPDGSVLIYSVATKGREPMLYALRTDQLEARPVPGTANASQPLFSPNGQWLAFEVADKEKKVRLDGSAPVTIATGGSNNGADWTIGDELVVGATGRHHGLSRVSVAGGEFVPATSPDSTKGELDHVWPIAFPDGKTIAFAVWYGTLSTSQMALASLDDGRVYPLGLKGVRALAVLDGMLIYLQADGAVIAVPVDAASKRATGKPVPVHDPVQVVAGNNGNSGIFISPGGALVRSMGGTRSALAWSDPSGRTVQIAPEVRGFFAPRISPDGRRIAVGIRDEQRSDVWIYELETTTLSRLTSSETVSSLEWTRDSKNIVFSAQGDAQRSAVYIQTAAGGAPAAKLFEHAELAPLATRSPDGRSLVIQTLHNNTWDLFRVPLDSQPTAAPYLTSRTTEAGAAFSPDGRWIAMISDETNATEVYVRSFPDPSSRIQISVGGGVDPIWSKDGTRLFYRAGATVMVARLSLSPALRVLGRDTVMALSSPPGFFSSYDVTPDGRRFVTLLSRRDDFQLVVSPNWITELRRRVAGNRN
jgi:eukaryotic-like serine/threonine-protein kinase